MIFLFLALTKGSKTEKQDSKESKQTDEKGKTGKPAGEQEEKPAPLPSAYDEDLMLRAAMYGVLFQAYADKVTRTSLTCHTLHLSLRENYPFRKLSYLKPTGTLQ